MKSFVKSVILMFLITLMTPFFFLSCSESSDDPQVIETWSTDEICDAQDNNNDGQIDEDWAEFLGKPCAMMGEDGQPEDCYRGLYFCSPDGQSVVCIEQYNSGEERCDGFDNNCNGLVDENYDQDQDHSTSCGTLYDTASNQFVAGQLDPRMMDCNDNDPASKIGRENCQKAGVNDVDGDGYVSIKAGGSDCDDNDYFIHPMRVDQTYAGEYMDGTPAFPYTSLNTALYDMIQYETVEKSCYKMEVGPGTYYETLNFLGVPIMITSTNGPRETIIDAENIRRAVVIKNVPEVGWYYGIDGFTIRNGVYSMWESDILDQNGGGILVSNASPIIRNNIIEDNEMNAIANDTPLPSNGGGIYVSAGPNVLIYNNIIRNNRSIASEGNTAKGGGISVVNSSSPVPLPTGKTTFPTIPTIPGLGDDTGDDTPLDNPYGDVPLAEASPDDVVQIFNNLIYNNVARAGTGASSYGGGIYTEGANTFLVYNNTIVSNEAEIGAGALFSFAIPAQLLVKLPNKDVTFGVTKFVRNIVTFNKGSGFEFGVTELGLNDELPNVIYQNFFYNNMVGTGLQVENINANASDMPDSGVNAKIWERYLKTIEETLVTSNYVQKSDPQFSRNCGSDSVGCDWDFHLKANSPAIDVGTIPTTIPDGDVIDTLSFDADNRARPRDGPDSDKTSQYDAGAYEF
jgi:hypothetical protein